MARTDPDLAVGASLLDRLIDRDPRNPADPPSSRSQSVRQLKASLRRDLEWLLNTRRSPDAVPESYAELHRSLHNYGLPDATATSLSSPRARQRLLQHIEQTIDIFEPRLTGVRVRALENGASGMRVLRFQIEALLRMDPAPEQIRFDTVLQLTSGEYQVKGE
jgi:type VI secretion system protein ImpF